jgi:hypothetical protein
VPADHGGLYRLCVGGGVLISGLQHLLMQLLLHRMDAAAAAAA